MMQSPNYITGALPFECSMEICGSEMEDKDRMQNRTPLLELKGITKSFGSFVANDHIDLRVYPGEVHAVLGENGAGKSTLMNIIYGMYKPDSGTISINGEKVRIRSPKDAIRHKIGMVHQHFMLVEVLSAIDNISLLEDDRLFVPRDRKKVKERIEKLQQQYHIDVDIESPVEQLGIGMQQKVEILKLLYTGADVLIFDEPTAVLPPQECDSLFEIIGNLTAEGKGVIFISHKLDEVLRISRRITVLTRGRVVKELDASEADREGLVRLMVGEDIDMQIPGHREGTAGEVVVSARGLRARDKRKVMTLNGVDLDIHAGEIVGIAGVDGNGQTELAETLAGVRHAKGGKVFIDGTEVSTYSPRTFVRNHIQYVPADRNNIGSVPDFPLYENWLLRNYDPPRRGPIIDYHKVREEAAEAIESYDVRTRGVDERTAQLSGGNLQKFIMARSLRETPKLLICEYPTRGLDIRAAMFIREKIVEAKKAGCGVLLLSGDFDELFSLSDRLIVMYKGKIVGERRPEETTVREIGMLMMGGAADGKAD